MPYNGSGTFTRSFNWTNDANAGIFISSSRADTEDSGFATGLSTAICKDGQTTITQNIPFNNKKITGLGAGTLATDAAQLGQIQKGGSNYAVAGGTGNAITLSMSPVNTALTDGQRVYFQAPANNTGATTFAVDGLGSTPALVNLGLGALSGGEIVANGLYEAIWSAANSKWILLGQANVKGLSVVSGKTLTVNNSITIAGTDGVTMTTPSTSFTAARTDAAQTFTGTQTFSLELLSNNAVTVTSNAGTCPVTSGLDTFTNSSAATIAITIATSGAVDGQRKIVRIYDFSAATQTIGWTNTENSQISAPIISNGSTTLPLTVGFIFNGSTSKWRTVAVA